jgi:hypothetical protein
LRRFSEAFVVFVARNPNLSVFLLGFGAFEVSIFAWSWQAAGVLGGLILMGIAAYPYLAVRAD